MGAERSTPPPAAGRCAPRYERIAKRRGRKIAKVAVARQILTLCYYGLRDGEIRCLKHQPADDNELADDNHNPPCQSPHTTPGSRRQAYLADDGRATC